MGATASQFFSITIVYSTVFQGQIKEITKAPRHCPLRISVNSPHKWPVTQKIPWDCHHEVVNNHGIDPTEQKSNPDEVPGSSQYRELIETQILFYASIQESVMYGVHAETWLTRTADGVASFDPRVSVYSLLCFSCPNIIYYVWCRAIYVEQKFAQLLAGVSRTRKWSGSILNTSFFARRRGRHSAHWWFNTFRCKGISGLWWPNRISHTHWTGTGMVQC